MGAVGPEVQQRVCSLHVHFNAIERRSRSYVEGSPVFVAPSQVGGRLRQFDDAQVLSLIGEYPDPGGSHVEVAFDVHFNPVGVPARARLRGHGTSIYTEKRIP